MGPDMIYAFADGCFRFYTATYGSWANDATITFRVRVDTTPKARAAAKGIRNFDRLLRATSFEIQMWMDGHKGYPLIHKWDSNNT